MATKPFDHNTLARLIDAGTDCGARIVGQSGGWTVRVLYGAAEQTYAAHTPNPTVSQNGYSGRVPQ